MTVDLTLTDFGGGDRPLLVLGPSLGTSVAGLWGAVAERLADAFHVVGWDLPGHGVSPAATGFSIADLAASLAGSVEGRFGYAGVSIGGAVGQQLLLDWPDRVERAVLLSTAPRIGTEEDWRDRAARVRGDGVGWLLATAPERWFAPQHRSDAAAQALLHDLAGVDPDSYAAACDALAGFDVRSRLADIAAPVLAVAGAHDPVCTVNDLRHLADGVQDGQLAVLDTAGHQSPAEEPAVVAALVREPRPVSVARPAHALGMRVRREVLGDVYVDRATAAVDPFTAEFQRFLTEYAWGSVWTRPGLDRRSRSMITLTALVAGGHSEELAAHVRGAVRNGLSPEEIMEVLLQTAIYCGVPAANAAFRVAQRVLAEEQ